MINICPKEPSPRRRSRTEPHHLPISHSMEIGQRSGVAEAFSYVETHLFSAFVVSMLRMPSTVFRSLTILHAIKSHLGGNCFQHEICREISSHQGHLLADGSYVIPIDMSDLPTISSHSRLPRPVFSFHLSLMSSLSRLCVAQIPAPSLAMKSPGKRGAYLRGMS
ncbi:hypothetical protein JAAARDRAFT_663184 [Jaapia argillacea MUCL 33604]|uniref:Uncharacterized protein n=1 Tax=Jaapia argillacea MUCL 33604 TaxID=933084 RepID=A0A067P2P3_9AGAM|nr:hypothetical protein JAAARDRAFT_663184 [Jaapia argillacea MUCL 33604]